MSKSGQRPSKADVGGQRLPDAPKVKPSAQTEPPAKSIDKGTDKKADSKANKKTTKKRK